MGFDDVAKNMAKRKPRSPAFLLAVIGFVLVGINFFANQAAREGVDAPGRPTYWPAIIGVVCVIGGVVARRYPSVARRMLLALGGLALIGLNIVIDQWSHDSAAATGQSTYLL